jgi:hypothetical protein
MLDTSMTDRSFPAIRDSATEERVHSASSPDGNPSSAFTAVTTTFGRGLKTPLSPSSPSSAHVQARVDVVAEPCSDQRGREAYSFKTTEMRTARSATLTHAEKGGFKGAE